MSVFKKIAFIRVAGKVADGVACVTELLDHFHEDRATVEDVVEVAMEIEKLLPDGTVGTIERMWQENEPWIPTGTIPSIKKLLTELLASATIGRLSRWASSAAHAWDPESSWSKRRELYRLSSDLNEEIDAISSDEDVAQELVRLAKRGIGVELYDELNLMEALSTTSAPVGTPTAVTGSLGMTASDPLVPETSHTARALAPKFVSEPTTDAPATDEPASRFKEPGISNPKRAATLVEQFAPAEHEPLPLNLSPTDKLIVAVLRTAPARMTTSQIVKAIEEMEGAASEGTIKGALTSLVKRSVIDNKQDVVPKGYALLGKYRGSGGIDHGTD